MKTILLITVLSGAITFNRCYGQMDMGSHDMHHSHEMNDTSQKMEDMDMGNMCHSFSRNLPMTRNGSGTGWNPDAAPMYGIMKHTGDWMFMFHGDIFPRYNKQDAGNTGSRGNDMFDASDMLMMMGQRTVGGKGLFHFNVMLSTDALITGEKGYPLLFQTGESAYGQPLVDRQHPHDLFSELSVSYAYSFSKKADIFIYAGYPGEPALGPVTFMHRTSGQFMPDAPLSHHWVDATHIVFGVATVGFRYGKFKLEGSSFTGREPDENRYNFDKVKFDSWSTRISFNPNQYWALQASHGSITSPEKLRPSEDIQRNTASATFTHPFPKKSFFSATALWGQNIIGSNYSNAILTEATVKVKRVALYSRYEWVQKTVEELDLDTRIYGNGHRALPVNAITVGGAYDLVQTNPVTVACGAQFSLYVPDKELSSLYGSTPTAFEVYLHIYPKLMGK